MSCIIGVDTGGTFTDVVVIEEDGTTTSAKSATTPDDLAAGVVNAVTEAARQRRLSLRDLLARTKIFRLSGTTVTNVLITRQGAAAAMITTAGFEDTLHIGRATSTWAGLAEEEVRNVYRRTKPTPLVPKALVRGLDERVDSSGNVLVALQPEQVATATDELVALGAKSIAVGFVWSIRNPHHELEVARIIGAAHPGVSVHLSHQIAPTLGEYERFTTTAIDALVGPVMERFLGGVRSTLEREGFTGELIVAQADGGAVYAEETRPVSTLQSGPAAGVMASRNEGLRIGTRNIVTADVGGTSFDVAVVPEGAWMYAREPVAERFFLSLPMIEVESVGAGGGSIAWVDELDVLHVGPRSAGAQPGPVCYGNGGTEPTVTDAALVLGYVNPDYFLGGRVQLAQAKAEAAIEALGERIGLSGIRTAAGIFEIANAHMAGLVTRRVVSRGFDPRDFVVFAFGGAGGMHGAFYAAEADIAEVVVPSLAGTFSALGVTTAPLLHTVLKADFAPIPMAADRFRSNFEELEAQVGAMLDRDGIAKEDRTIAYTVEMRYGVQVHTVQLPVPKEVWETANFAYVEREFDALYDKLFGKGSGYAAAGRFITSFKVEGYGRLPIPERAAAAGAATSVHEARVGSREAYFEGAFVETSLYRFDDATVTGTIEGPAIVEAPETTIVIPPGCSAVVDEYLNVRISTAKRNGRLN
jgi:N-methylhydantoinase A